MNVIKVIELIAKHARCPRCGSVSIGGGTGSIIVDDDGFTRMCKCGFKVKLDENWNEIK